MWRAIPQSTQVARDCQRDKFIIEFWIPFSLSAKIFVSHQMSLDGCGVPIVSSVWYDVRSHLKCCFFGIATWLWCNTISGSENFDSVAVAVRLVILHRQHNDEYVDDGCAMEKCSRKKMILLSRQRKVSLAHKYTRMKRAEKISISCLASVCHSRRRWRWCDGVAFGDAMLMRWCLQS